MSKNDFFLVFWDFGPRPVTSKHYRNMFSILFDIENQIIFAKNSGTSRNKVKNPAKVGSREFFFSRFFEIGPDFST